MFDRSTPKLTDAQRKELQALQKDFNPKIAKILTDAQKTLSRGLQERPAPQPPDAGATQARVIPSSEPRDTHLNHPAFAGRTLKPGKTLVEIEAESEKRSQNQTPRPN